MMKARVVPMAKKCTPCMSQELKAIVIESVRDAGKRSKLEETLAQLLDCNDGTPLRFCGSGKKGSGRARSKYQEFISQCMQSKKIKGFGEAPKAMKECAAAWRQQKGK